MARGGIFSASRLRRGLRPIVDQLPRVRAALKGADLQASRLHHSVATRLPAVIQPRPRQLTIAVTADCNLRCVGCNYGDRSFMAGNSLTLDDLRAVLDDARDAGVETVRLYGGEPLLHRELPQVVEHAVGLGLKTYVTTNGLLLESRIDQLFEAGLRLVTIGFYGIDGQADRHTQRRDYFKKLERSLSAVRAKYGAQVELQSNYVLMRPFCSVEHLDAAWALATKFDMFFHIDLVSYSLPFFTTGPDDSFQFTLDDMPALRPVVARLEALKLSEPKRLAHSVEFLRSIPDWLIKRAEMRVPCDAYDLIWIGADGSVQLCDVTFKLGNVREHRLRDILFGPEHKAAARDAFLLKCPNCMCKVETRIQKHAPSMRRYSKKLG